MALLSVVIAGALGVGVGSSLVLSIVLDGVSDVVDVLVVDGSGVLLVVGSGVLDVVGSGVQVVVGSGTQDVVGSGIQVDVDLCFFDDVVGSGAGSPDPNPHDA